MENKKKEVVFITFQEIKDPVLRAWNQLQFAMNLEKDHGDKISSKYVEFLTQPERMNMMAIGMRIVVKGEEFVRKEVLQQKGV